MKKLLLALFAALLVVSPADVFAQDTQSDHVDVIYLKNGGERRGTIIEQDPGESITIETVNGQVFVYEISEVERIEREQKVDTQDDEATESRPAPQHVSHKSEVGAFALSFLFTGGGQYYNGQIGKGAALTGIGITGGVLLLASGPNDSGQAGLGLLMSLGAWIYSMIDAPIVANNINERARRQQQSRYGSAMEFQGNGYTVGVDATRSKAGTGMKVAIHF